MNILFLAAEAEPFVKIGGLADVAGSLPLALRRLPAKSSAGPLDVRLVLPLHQAARVDPASLHLVAEYSVCRGGLSIPVKVLETSLDGMPVYFISGPPISNTPSVYSPDPAYDREKYAFFSLAALELIPHLAGWQPDVIHANDWHTSLALFAVHSGQNGRVSPSPRTLLTIHNLAYFGGDGSDVLAAYGLNLPVDPSLPLWAQSQVLPLGLWSANAIVPVSPTYAREILTPDYGCGLDPYLKTRLSDLTGILNGLDTSFWDPAADDALPECFNIDQLPARSVNKSALQKTLVLKQDTNVPLMAMVGRVDYQKGLDIAFDVLRRLPDRNWQFVILGSGDPTLEETARQLQSDFPDHVRAVIRFDAGLSHLLYGGADIFLMPSRYEPCGLAQMIAMRYGCVPVVHATGGLIDTVHEGRTGFLFQDPDPSSMGEALARAFQVYSDPKKWQLVQRNAMQEDFSWSRSADQYAGIYSSLVSKS